MLGISVQLDLGRTNSLMLLSHPASFALFHFDSAAGAS